MKRLFEVIVEKTIYVLADDEREAELEAGTYEQEEDGYVLACVEVRDEVRVPNEYMDSIPYGDNPEDLTVQEILRLPLPPVPYVDPPEQRHLEFPGGVQPT